MEMPAPTTAVRACPLRTDPLIVLFYAQYTLLPAGCRNPCGADHALTPRRSNPLRQDRADSTKLSFQGIWP